MSSYLSITIIKNPYDNIISFLNVMENKKWIYVLSDSQSVLHNFKHKILSITPEKYLQYISVEIGYVNDLSQDEKNYNNLNKDYIKDKLHSESICNSSESSDKYSLEEFTLDIWKNELNILLSCTTFNMKKNDDDDQIVLITESHIV